jgi:hypothetical protein
MSGMYNPAQTKSETAALEEGDMLRHWVRVALAAGAAMVCGLAVGHQEHESAGADGLSSMMLDCEHLPAKAVSTLPQPVGAWTRVACRHTGQLLVESPGWQWRYPASFTTPVIVPATMASPHVQGARYFTDVSVAASEPAAAARLHDELSRDLAVYADNAGTGTPASAFTLVASNDLGDQLRIHFLPRAGGDLIGVVCTPRCIPESTFIVQKRGG